MTRASERGFTLVETMVAFAVLALCLAVLFELAGTGLRAERQANARLVALRLAESHLARLGRAEPIIAGTTDGRYDEIFRWSLAAEPRPGVPAVPAVTPWHLELVVAWGGEGDGGALTLSTLALATAEGTP